MCTLNSREAFACTREWLVGFPPRIRFTGALPDDFCVKIDDKPAHVAADGAFEVSGWNGEGEHRVWFVDQAENYRIVRPAEDWVTWQAHDFGLQGTICGATVHYGDDSAVHLMVPVSNPVVLGANPGEVFLCAQRSDVRSERIFASVPFEPVWALPADAAHCDKRTARVVLLSRALSVPKVAAPRYDAHSRRAIQRWCAAISDAGRKGLKVAIMSDEAAQRWTEYRTLAHALRRRMR